MSKIAVIGGDGIGPEVVNEGIKVLKKIESLDENINFDFEFFPWGCDYYLEQGKMMPENGIDILKSFDAIFLGAVGAKEVPDNISLWQLLLKIRQEFKQNINLRPIQLLDGAPCPLKGKTKEDIDMIVVRENSEGEYAGIGDRIFKGGEDELVLQTGVFSKKGTKSVIRYAYELAKKENKTLTNISKANALNYSMVFWDEIFEEVGKEYPEVETNSYLVDAAAMFFVKEPERFEIVVTSNLFGDILTDLGAGIAGGMGLAAGANINPTKEYPSMFEPIHGSAPDIAGKGVANPLAAIWSVSQMLDYLGYNLWSKKVLKAIEKSLLQKDNLTPDLGGKSKTSELGDYIVSILEGIK